MCVTTIPYPAAAAAAAAPPLFVSHPAGASTPQLQPSKVSIIQLTIVTEKGPPSCHKYYIIYQFFMVPPMWRWEGMKWIKINKEYKNQIIIQHLDRFTHHTSIHLLGAVFIIIIVYVKKYLIWASGLFGFVPKIDKKKKKVK